MNYPISIKESTPSTIAEFVANDFRTAEVFKRFGLDFCCGGKKSLENACKEKGIDYEELSTALSEVDLTRDQHQLQFNEMELGDLIDHIQNTHHHYVRSNIPLIQEFMDKVVRVHGEANPELLEISKHWAQLSRELQLHMHKEENILFPSIREKAQGLNRSNAVDSSCFGSIRNPISVMELEHDQAGTTLRIIRELSNGYTPPPHACNTYRVLYFKLEEFENDLHTHVHLENNILFPKAIAME